MYFLHIFRKSYFTLLTKYADGCGESGGEWHIRLPRHKFEHDNNAHHNNDDQKPNDLPEWPQEILAIVVGPRDRKEIDKRPKTDPKTKQKNTREKIEKWKWTRKLTDARHRALLTKCTPAARMWLGKKSRQSPLHPLQRRQVTHHASHSGTIDRIVGKWRWIGGNLSQMKSEQWMRQDSGWTHLNCSTSLIKKHTFDENRAKVSTAVLLFVRKYATKSSVSLKSSWCGNFDGKSRNNL